MLPRVQFRSLPASDSLSVPSTSYSQLQSPKPTRLRRSCSRVIVNAFTSGWERDTYQPPVAGLRKEKKKLAKTLKSHRKRVERLLASAKEESSGVALTGILEELKLLHRTIECSPLYDEDSSSSSDSDDENCENSHVRRRRGLESGTQDPRPGAGGVVRPVVGALAAVSLDVPAVDFDDLAFPVELDVPGTILVCQGSKCQSAGALEVLQTVSAVAGTSAVVDVMPCKCLGKCKQGPALRVKSTAGGQPSNTLYTAVAPAQVKGILARELSSAAGVTSVLEEMETLQGGVEVPELLRQTRQN